MGREVVEALAEGAWADAAAAAVGFEGFFEFAEAFGAAGQVAKDESGPLVADNLHGAGDAANTWFKLGLGERGTISRLPGETGVSSGKR